MSTSETVFDEARARAVLGRAAERIGLPAEGRLAALSENAVFELDGAPVVAKVAREAAVLERADRSLKVAAWLAAHGVPAVRPADGVPAEALLVDGHPVTFWARLPEAVRPAGPADLAPLLRGVHALGAPEGLGLPPRELLGNVDRWLDQATGHIDPADAEFLRRRRDEIQEKLPALRPVLPPGPIHGDALPRNVHVGPDGPLLIDLETFADDLREHDLVVLQLSHDRYGLDHGRYRAFVDGYGFDVAEWEGAVVLRGARETASAAWVAQQAAVKPSARAEFAHRVASLRSGDATVRWNAF
ncbi:aminoglycoside phosphotransferase [Mangrovactinospora gilvigrisea]|uniref:Aminoglycoside phosphotransferase n=1 Tax=Mangrovactinospora gilvigrisea TaxID=1428644 RepID=A0A1J7BAA0_9ACTN|nr:aminoglycoside phosphotransferase family protein [Mangrovactinospora gilvigrisea]OIV35587.1 aminoglycoside phosphotransferase [Mangrovactinospora gilvigrisea]